MGLKFFIILCLAVLLQDVMGTFAQRSYNPRFRNVNRRYSNDFDDGEIVEEMYLLDENNQQLRKTDVIMVSLPVESSFMPNKLADHHHKEKHSQHIASGQRKPQKPIHSEFLDAEQAIIQNKPIVLQLLGWTGNPPQPIVLPPMPTKTIEMAPAKVDMENVAVPIFIKEEKIENVAPIVIKQDKIENVAVPIVIKEDKMENVAVPIVIKEEIMEEIKPAVMEAESIIALVQDNKQELNQKPELVIVETVENKVMNEEPSILVEALPQVPLMISTSASEDLKKPTEIENIKDNVIKTPVILEVISESVPVMNESNKPVPEMFIESVPVMNESNKPVPEILIEKESKKEILKIKPEVIESAIVADMKINLSGAGIKNEVSSSTAHHESADMSVIIPENLSVMKDTMQTSFPSDILKGEDKKKVLESKIENIRQNIDSDVVKIMSSEEKPVKSEKVVEVVSYILEKAPENLPIKNGPKESSMSAVIPEKEIPSETKLKEDIIVVAEESSSEKQPMLSSIAMPQKEEKIGVILMEEASPVESDKKSDIAEPINAEIIVKENASPENSLTMVKPEEIIVQVPLQSTEKETINSENSYPINKDKDIFESKLEEILVQTPLQIKDTENASPIETHIPNRYTLVAEPLEVTVVQAPLKTTEKETASPQNSSPLIEENESLKSKPETITLQSILQKLVLTDLNTKINKQSGQTVQNPNNVEHKLDLKNPEEKLKPLEKLSVQEPKETQVLETEALLTAAKPASLVENISKKDPTQSELSNANNPKKEIPAIQMDMMAEDANRKRKPKPGKKRPHHHKPSKKPATTTTTNEESEAAEASSTSALSESSTVSAISTTSEPSTTEKTKVLVTSTVPDLGF